MQKAMLGVTERCRFRRPPKRWTNDLVRRTGPVVVVILGNADVQQWTSYDDDDYGLQATCLFLCKLQGMCKQPFCVNCYDSMTPSNIAYVYEYGAIFQVFINSPLVTQGSSGTSCANIIKEMFNCLL